MAGEGTRARPARRLGRRRGPVRRASRFTIDRPAVFDLLDTWHPLTVVEAPRGFGKTTAVARWIERRVKDDVEVVWVSLGTPVESADGLWSRVQRELTGENWTGPGAEQAFAEHLQAWPDRRHLLVVDDAHTAVGARWPVEATDKVIHHPNLHLIVITRVLAPITPWNVHEIESQWISMDNLVFTDQEVIELFDLTGVDLGDQGRHGELVALADDLGRWPFLVHRTAVQLAGDYAVRPEETSSPERLARTLESLRTETADYLRRDFLPGVLAPEQLVLAARVATIVDLTDETLALAVPDDAQRLELLGGLQQAGLVTMTSGIRQVCYRFPPRITQALRERAALAGGQEGALQRRVVEHHRLSGDYERAWAQARALGDPSLQADLIETSWLDVMGADGESFLDLLQELPDEVFTSHPGAWWVREALFANGAAVPPGIPTPGELLGEGWPVSERQALTALAGVIALRVRGELSAAGQLASRLMQLSDRGTATAQPAVQRLRRMVLVQAAFVHQLEGRATQAHTLWEAVQHGATETSDEVSTGMTSGALALLAAERGDLRETETRLAEHRGPVPLRGWFGGQAAGPALIARTWLAIERKRIGAAAAGVDELLRRRHRDETWAATTRLQATFELLWGDSAAMLATLEAVRAERASLAGPGTHADLVLRAVAADHHLSLGHATAAASVLEGAPQHALIEVRRARLALLNGSYEDVLARSLYDAASTARERLELLLLHAAASLRTGDQDRALRLVRRSERLLGRTRLMTPLSGLPRPDLEALAEMASPGPLVDLVSGGVPTPFPETVEIVVLTEREAVVLDGLVRGLGVEGLAQRLFVSPNTVKTQIRSLYRKLGARSRAEALMRAQDLGLRA